MQRRSILGIFLVACIGLLVGWKLFWFLCDDAYIAFRYVSNSQLGLGYTWNAPPYRPVDGYTSFLWVLLLDVVWRVTGIEAPDSANWLSLLFAVGQLALITALAVRSCEHLPVWRGKWLLVSLVLLGVLTNRTFLAWTSSGLETALFNFWLLSWIYLALGREGVTRFWVPLLTLIAFLIVLTRPDGLLFCTATFALLLVLRWQPDLHLKALARRSSLGLILMLALFFGWKRLKYGAWLPNTYYAKISDWWPEAGLRYLASFVLEYALWLWLLVVVAGLLAAWRRRLGFRWLDRHALVDGLPPGKQAVLLLKSELEPAPVLILSQPALSPRSWLAWISCSLVVATLLAHVAYYSLVAGGDHFEYRPFSYLIGPIYLSFLWALGRLRVGLRGATLLLLTFIGASALLPWTHWALSADLHSREATHKLRVAVAPHFPPGLQWYGRHFDRLQFYCIDHYVGLRHQEHKVFLEHQRRRFPPRSIGARLPRQGFPSLVEGAVGYVGWALPQVAVIDVLGLNDYFIARNTEVRDEFRMMAHERRPPVGYLEALMPNVALVEGKWTVNPRVTPLTGQDIERIERQYLLWTQEL